MSIPDLDKIIKMSSIFHVSTDFLLKDELEETEFLDTENSDTDDDVRSVSVEEANAYMEVTERVAGKIALGVLMCILSPVCLIFFGGLSEYNGSISENAAGGIGTVISIIFMKKWLKFCFVCVSIIVDRRKAWVMPESKYSIGGIKNGISILFFLL